MDVSEDSRKQRVSHQPDYHNGVVYLESGIVVNLFLVLIVLIYFFHQEPSKRIGLRQVQAKLVDEDIC